MPALLLGATPSPSPSPLPQADPGLGSPGFIGFVFTFGLALVVIGLALLMTRELRKVNRNARLAAAADERTADKGTGDEAADDEAADDEGGTARDGGHDEPGGRG
jgi:hypothetical protein